jgi:exodeoxyribonuclease VII small subunit
MSNPATNSFLEHYQRLQASAEALQTMQEPDVDKIMPLVNQGMEAYREVKARIDSVRAALNSVSGDVRES